MKVLLVNGSPNEAGCTYTALAEVAKKLNAEGVETEIFWIGRQPIGGCAACKGCRNLGKCAFDDCVNEFAEKAKTADGFVFGSPVHFAGVSGNMKCFMDRLFYSAPSDTFRLKPAGVVVSARRAGTTAAYEQLLKYPAYAEMPIVSSRYWTMVHGSCPDDVRKDEEGMATMRVLANNLAYALKCKNAAQKQNVCLPEPEKPAKTNFIRG